jgi:hypothetical protein
MKLLRPLTRVLAGTVVLASLLPAAAAAKTGIVIDSTPEGLPAGDTWMPVIRYIRDDGPVDLPASRHITLRLTSLDSGASLTFPAHRIPQAAWQAKVIFPTSGRWRYSVEGFGGNLDNQFWDPVTIAPTPHAAPGGRVAPRSPAARHPVRQQSPSVSWLIGGTTALLLLVALVLLLWRRRNSAM